MTTQTTELIRFISGIPVLSDGTIPRNTIDSSDPFVSDLYTPDYSLSLLARMTQNVLSGITLVSVETGDHTVTKKLINSDLSSYAPDMYLLSRIVVLESFALVYHIEEKQENLRYVTDKDINRIKTNIGYLTDYFGTEDKYHGLIETFRHMYIALGYIEHQIDVILSDYGSER